MKLYWTPAARKDRREIARYIAAHDLQAAVKLDETFQQRAMSLLLHPEMGRFGRMPGTRELVVHRHYLLVYAIRQEELRIIRTLHTSRQWPLSEE